MPIVRSTYVRMAVCLLVTLPFAAVAGQLNAIVADAKGQPLIDAVVYLLPRAVTALPAPRAAVIDQKDRMFVPAVSVVQTGTAITFPNSDNIRHQIYSFSPAKTFNLKLYSGKPASPELFDKPGVVVLGCNIHDRMVAWVAVVDSAWFGKSGADGKLSIGNVPDGHYQLKLWHPGQHREAEATDLEVKGVVSKTLAIDATPIMEGMSH
jgi:plastocyanin